jgi:hypothetical protein
MEDTVQLRWRRSTRSGGGNADNCVEVATSAGRVMVRDSKDPHGPILAVDHERWRAFLAGIRR